jgi:hypothetical protein
MELAPEPASRISSAPSLLKSPQATDPIDTPGRLAPELTKGDVAAIQPMVDTKSARPIRSPNPFLNAKNNVLILKPSSARNVPPIVRQSKYVLSQGTYRMLNDEMRISKTTGGKTKTAGI